MDLPLSLSDMSLWLAVTALILLITSELASQYHRKTNVFVNKKKLQNVALTVSALFLITVAMKIMTIL